MSVLSTILVVVSGAISLAVFMWILVVSARRVLGAPTGLGRTVLVMAVVLASAGPVLTSLASRFGVLEAGGTVSDPGTAAILVLAAGCLTFVLALAALVVSELVLPSHRDVIGLRSPWALRASLRQGWRVVRISFVFARHGVGRMVLTAIGSASPAERRRTAGQLRLALEACGPTFVKFGQMLSTRPELVPAELVEELARLHADVAPEPYDRIQRVLAEDGIGPEAFSELDPVPLAAASVGQVHRATLPDGERVVVKVQRPGARRHVEDDVAVLRRLAAGLAATSPWLASLGLEELVDGFAASLAEELDYRIEADNATAVAARMEPGGPVLVPRVDLSLSSRRVMVQQWVEGTPISAAAEELAGLTPERRGELADGLLTEVMHQVLITGLFHADLHPGNVMLTADGRLAMLDFGSVGRLDSGSRGAIGRLLYTVRSGDAAAATDALFELLDRPDDIDERAVQRELGALLLRVPAAGGTGALFAELSRFALRYGFGIPTQVAAVFRTLASLEGTLRLIDPHFDVVASAETAGRQVASDSAGRVSLQERLADRLVPLLPTLEQLPRRMDRLLEKAETGRMELALRPFADPADRRFLASLVHQGVVTVLAATSLIGGVLLVTSDPGPMVTGSFGLFDVLGAAMLFVGVILSLRALAQVFVRRPGSTDG